MQKTKDDHKGAHRRRRAPGSESRSSQFITLGAGVRGWGCAGTLPSYPKGIPDVDVAAGGCPSSSRQGWREGLGAPAGPAFRQEAGLTADLSNWRGERVFPAASRWP